MHSGRPVSEAGSEQSTNFRDCAKVRMSGDKAMRGYTKSEPGAVATGSFPRCSTMPLITQVTYWKNRNDCACVSTRSLPLPVLTLCGHRRPYSSPSEYHTVLAP